MSTLSKVSLRLAAGIALALLACAGSAAADDADIRTRIEQRLEKSRLQREGDIQVDVREGRAVLSGAVTNLPARRKAEKAALKETRTVDNRLRVLPSQPMSDAHLRALAARAVLAYPYYSVFDSVALGVEDGVVTLVGSVRHPYRKAEIEKRVSSVPGVRELKSLIRVQPASMFDDQLRADLYRAIYGSDHFVRYAQWTDPPVRIVVENGKVTLTGSVNTRLEQQLLGHLARTVMSFGVDNQVVLEGEEHEEARADAPSDRR